MDFWERRARRIEHCKDMLVKSYDRCMDDLQAAKIYVRVLLAFRNGDFSRVSCADIQATRAAGYLPLDPVEEAKAFQEAVKTGSPRPGETCYVAAGMKAEFLHGDGSGEALPEVDFSRERLDCFSVDGAPLKDMLHLTARESFVSKEDRATIPVRIIDLDDARERLVAVEKDRDEAVARADVADYSREAVARRCKVLEKRMAAIRRFVRMEGTGSVWASVLMDIVGTEADAA